MVAGVVSTFPHYLANKVSNKRKDLLIADFRYKAATSCSVFAKSSTSLSYTVVVSIEYSWDRYSDENFHERQSNYALRILITNSFE